jgi:hypothetical protein
MTIVITKVETIEATFPHVPTVGEDGGSHAL